MEILIAYDIATHDRAGTRRLARTARMCEGYGLRVQKSVFECRLSNADHQQLVSDALEVIDPQQDSFNLYRFPLDLARARQSLGRPPGTTHHHPWII